MNWFCSWRFITSRTVDVPRMLVVSVPVVTCGLLFFCLFFPWNSLFFSTFFGSSLSAMAVKRNREALFTRSALVIACVPETSLGKPVGQLRCHTG
jgi:hypothetical protein